MHLMRLHLHEINVSKWKKGPEYLKDFVLCCPKAENKLFPFSVFPMS